MATSDPQQPQQDPAEGGQDGPDDDPSRGDPETGSTKPDPKVDDTGLPPEGEDPMEGGEAPTG